MLPGVIAIPLIVANAAWGNASQPGTATSQDHPAGQRPRSEPADGNNDIVVIGRRRPRPLDTAVPTREVSEQQISTYGALSVGELIRRLQEEQGGRPFSIIVNGRRVSSIADINELPAEALNSLQVYAPTEGSKFGFNPTNRLLNVTLKQRFRSLSIDVAGEGSTDGGGRSIRDTPRGVDIAGDNRRNGQFGVRVGQGLLAGQRPRLPGDPPGDGGRSLLPRSRTIDATLGTSRPLGAGSLDVSLSGTVSRTSLQRTGAIRQSDDNRSAGVSAGYNLYAGGMFGFVSLNLNTGNSGARITGLCGATNRTCILQNLDTGTLNGTVSGLMTGKIATLSAGDLGFDISLQRNGSRTQIRDRLNGGGAAHSTYAATSGRVGLTLPLVPPRSALGFLGKVQIAPALTYDAIDGLNGTFGTNLGVNWAPSSAWQIDASFGSRASLLSNEQLNAPARTIVGVTVYDYRALALVPVEQIVGGAALARQSSRDLRVNASYNGMIGRTRFNANVDYSDTTTRRPAFSITEPSRFFESVFPDRFVRDAAGTLIRVDTRPFNAVRRSSAMLSGTINLSGNVGGTTAGALPASGLSWSASLGSRLQLRQILLLAPGIPAIDTFETPLSLSTNPTGRQQWNASLRVNASRWGGGLSGNLDSGLRSTVFGDPSSGVHVASLIRTNANVFFALSKSKAPGTAFERSTAMPSVVRLELEVRNMFNARPRIETFDAGTAVRLNPWLLDPLGRVVLLSLRVS